MHIPEEMGSMSIGFYINSWARAQTEYSQGSCRSYCSCKILCITEDNPLSEIMEVTHTVASGFENFRFAAAVFNAVDLYRERFDRHGLPCGGGI